ncbi:tRNA (5-methylaminomethyl-2-thiouridine)(34)-methyltransferase MnmD [Roseobacteraceae bacterium S113]
MSDQSHELDWRGNVPVSQQFDDPFYSLDNGMAETEHVFLAGNDLPARFAPGFHIAELGFGSGLNLLVALQAWRASGVPGRLNFTSFEAFPMAPSDMISAQQAFAPLQDIAAELAPFWEQGAEEIALEDMHFTLIKGDARATLPHWHGAADAWFLDGFSPAKNPELWGPELMAAVGQHTSPGGTCATYTAAGHVRRGLEAAGFAISRAPGFGRKRHMTRGVKSL